MADTTFAAELAGARTAGAIIDDAARASIASIGQTLRSQGWSVISSLSMTPGEAFPRIPAVSGVTRSGLTAVVKEVSPVSVAAIRFVHTNWLGAGLDAFVPPQNDIFVSDGVVDQNNLVYSANWGADGRLGTVTSRTFRVSDSVQANITKNVPYTVREYAGVASNVCTVPTLIGIAFNAFYSQPNGGDSAGPEDSTQAAFASADRTQALTCHIHTAILGYTGQNPVKSIASIGDSISVGLHDVCTYGTTGFGGVAYRVANGYVSPNAQHPPAAPNFGFLGTGHSGATLTGFLSNGGNQGPLDLASMATTVWDDFGINDLFTGRSLAALQADRLTLAGKIAANSQKHIVQTLFPQTTSTNGFVDTAGQTQTSFETARAAFNSWLRDTSANGYIAQAKQLYPNYRGAVFDPCRVCEVNAQGALTLNGGFWKPPTGTALFSGSVTGGAGSKTSFTDSAMTAADNTHRSRAVRWLTGANAGAVTGISYQRSVGQYGVTGTTNNIAVGDTYEIWADIATKEGTHPLAFTVAAAATDFIANFMSLVE